MEKQYYLPKATNEDYVKRFEFVLEDYIDLYARVVDKIKTRVDLKDDRAVQAAAYTMWRQTTDTLAQPGLIVWAPSEHADENLENFDAYAVWHGNQTTAFVELAKEYIGIEEEIVREVLNSMEITSSMFARVGDFIALADLVKLNHLRLLDEIEDEDEAEKEAVRLTNKAMGIKPGKSVDDIIGGFE